MVVGQLVVIESEKVEDGAVDVANVVNTIDGFGSQFVRGSDGVSRFGPAPGEPHRHGFGIVVASVSGASATKSVVGGASEFPTPDYECFVQHAPLFEILEKSSDGFVDRADQ